jgi:hypothetical protein
MKKIILRRKNDDTEGDKYKYFVSCSDDGIEITTPFKDNATILHEGDPIKVVSRDWVEIEIDHL